MMEKIKNTLMFLGLGLAVILLIALCSTVEYTKAQEQFKIEAPGIRDVCHSVEMTSCGATLSGCKSKKEYKCVTNMSIEKVK